MFLTWAAVAASVVAWGLAAARRPADGPWPVVVDPAAVPAADGRRLWGGASGSQRLAEPGGGLTDLPAGEAEPRLLGVVRRAAGGVALFAAGDRPPRALRPGEALEGGWRLATLEARAVWLVHDDGRRRRLVLPEAEGTGAPPPAPLSAPPAAAVVPAIVPAAAVPENPER